jgi:hypothetical protein
VAAIACAQVTSPKNTGTSIQGKVIQDPGGEPIRKANVQISVRDGQGNYSATTDAEGLFRIDNIKPARYTIELVRLGFVQSGRHSVSISLLSGQGTADVVLHMQLAGAINGKILDMDGDPMDGVGVNALRVDSPSGGRISSGSTNDLGEFRIPNLRAGRYTIMANPPRSPAPQPEGKGNAREQIVNATTYYPGTLDKEQAVAVDVHPGEEIPINFRVLTSRAYRVTGTVLGLPAGARALLAMLLPRDHDGSSSDGALKEGRFEFKDVLPGSYTVRLEVLRDYLAMVDRRYRLCV